MFEVLQTTLANPNAGSLPVLVVLWSMDRHWARRLADLSERIARLEGRR